jgi:hypothetical protein
VGDFLGLLVLGLAIYYFLVGSKRAPLVENEPAASGAQLPR